MKVIRWLADHRDARSVARLAVTIVLIAAAGLLYVGLYGLAGQIGYYPGLEWAYPLVIDGTVAAGYALVYSTCNEQSRMYGWLMIGVGAVLSGAGQFAHAVGPQDWPDWVRPVAAVVPAVLAPIAWHMLIRLLRERDTESGPAIRLGAPHQTKPALNGRSDAASDSIPAAVTSSADRPAVANGNGSGKLPDDVLAELAALERLPQERVLELADLHHVSEGAKRTSRVMAVRRQVYEYRRRQAADG